MPIRIAIVLLLLLAPAAPGGQQLPNLNSTPTADRFPITGRTWPATPGAASICLWEDDKLCAFAMSVDDNIAPQVPDWIKKGEEVGFPVTWFVITDRIGGSNSGFNGTWATWAGVLAKGHDVQSHTRRHLHVEESDWPGIEEEYAGSRRAIEENLPGHRCDFLAYPGGPNSSYNDRDAAAEVYGGARGGAGSGFNRPARIDYLAIKNGSFGLNTGSKFNDLLSLFDAGDLRYYRGWAAPLFHQVNDWAGVEPYFTFIRQYRSDIWAARFSDVGKYGQERDTAVLQITQNSPEQIALTLTDDMLDSVFDYPLTVKIRLPDHWNSVLAMQNSEAAPAKFIRHAGAPFALVRAVPDRGAVIVTQATSANVGGQSYRSWLRNHALPLDHTGLGAPDAEVSGDGIKNLMKYALGLDPRAAAGPTVSAHLNGSLTLDFKRPFPVPPDVDYIPEAGSDLQGWSSDGVTMEEDGVVNGMQTMRLRDPVAAGSATPARFLRLRVRSKAGVSAP